VRQVPASITSRLHLAAGRIADEGLEHTRVDDIAALAGIPRATLYYHFAGKEEILAHLLTDVVSAVARAVHAAAEGLGSARQRLTRVVEAQLAVMAENPATCRALLAEFGRVERIPALATAIEDAYYAPVRRLLDEGARDGSLRRVDSSVGSRFVLGAVTVNGLARIVRDDAVDPRKLAREVMALLLGGLAGPGEQSTNGRRPRPKPTRSLA
jgi:AcrR family transcriptional regulator